MATSGDDSSFPVRVFDPDEDVLVTERRLPHWGQAHTLCFITWRTWDSIPGPILRRWLKERWEWLLAHGVDTAKPNWQQEVEQLPRSLQAEFHRTFSDRWHEQLDRGHGACVLRNPQLAKIVADSLIHFDGERYLPQRCRKPRVRQNHEGQNDWENKHDFVPHHFVVPGFLNPTEREACARRFGALSTLKNRGVFRQNQSDF